MPIEPAGELGDQLPPFQMAITVAGVLSLMAYWGYLSNTLICEPRRNQFTESNKIGAPLN